MIPCDASATRRLILKGAGLVALVGFGQLAALPAQAASPRPRHPSAASARSVLAGASTEGPCDHQAATAGAALPLNTKPWAPAEMVTVSPSLMRPARIISASGSCTAFWITRLSGRAP